jgi:M3 family oligoendopeptidase
MKFSEMEYERPDMNILKSEFRSLLNEFENANSCKETRDIIEQVNKLRVDYESMMSMAFIHYSIDTCNKSFIEEQDFFDDNNPIYENFVTEYYRALTNSKYRSELEEVFGKYLFTIAELELKTFNPEIIDDLKKENHLTSKYVKLIASAKIMFEGQERNLQQLHPFMESTERKTRKAAFEAYWEFFENNSEELDNIFDELVKLRDGMAKKLGYKNFIELGYARMGRSDYDYDMVAKFRKKIKTLIVPLATELRKRQCRRLGLDSLKAYDFPIQFKSGNAKPKGSPKWIVEVGKIMYDELSPEASEFFNFMIDNDLMDLYNRKGKADMGYCDYIPKFRNPFIFANMDGTEYDITVLTHEAGHALQSYLSRDIAIKEYTDPTSDSAEIHSMGMEFLTWPWMDLFFKEDTDKFKFSHINGSILFLPYGVLVDEFQHYVYENSEVSPIERKRKWRELENIYLPTYDFDGNKFLENGARWQRQGHIYEVPFYYIDYCLAQICAYQFWQKAREDQVKATEDYIRLCKAGGSGSFLELVKIAGLMSPFGNGCCESLVGDVEKWLNGIDDTKF